MTAERLAAATMPATQAVLERAVAAGKLPGAVVAVGVGDAAATFVSVGRIADDPSAPAADPDSLWRVYSMTKPVTAAAAMMLVEEGGLDLDAPVSNYLAAFSDLRVLTDPERSLESRPASRPMTIRHLLTHTAGLGYLYFLTGPLLGEYERLGLAPGALDVRTEAAARPNRPSTLLAFADRVAQAPLLTDPGTVWNYSIAFDVMGAVIEAASGVPFDRFVDDRIFGPLEMASSFWTVPAAASARLADNYANYTRVAGARMAIDPGASSIFLEPPTFPYGGAGLVMSARDYDVFLHCIQEGGRLGGVEILKADTVASMTSDLLPPGLRFGGSVDATNVTSGTMAQPAGFGAGGSVYTADGPGGSPGRGSYGWGGAAGTMAMVDPLRKLRLTIMLNVWEGIPGLAEEIGAAMATDLKARAPGS